MIYANDRKKGLNMSHVSNLEIIIKDLEALRKAAAECGLEFMPAATYKWYGQFVGDYPLPEGFTPEELGHCEYKMSIPGDEEAYEVGVVPRKDGQGYTLLYDFWGECGQALVEKIGGQDGDKLKQRYAVNAATFQAERQGFRVQEFQATDGSVQLRCMR